MAARASSMHCRHTAIAKPWSACRSMRDITARPGSTGCGRSAGRTGPGPTPKGKGEASIIIDKRATAAQREALLRILGGKDTVPGATFFQVFSSTLEKVHDPIFADIEFEVDVDARKARLKVADLVEARGEPIRNP